MNKLVSSLLCVSSLLISISITNIAFGKEISIVQIGDYSGPKKATGQAWRLGTQIAFEQANNSGVLGNNKIKFTPVDDQYNANKTVPLLQDAITQENPVMIVGVRGTANAEAVITSGLLNKYDIPLLGVYSGANYLRATFKPHVFHIRASYEEEVNRIIKHFSVAQLHRIAFVSENSPFGDSMSVAFGAAIMKFSVKVAERVQVESNSTNVKAVTDRIQASKPTAIFLGTSGRVTSDLIKAIRESNWDVPVAIISINDIPEIIRYAGNTAAWGLYQTQVVPDPVSCVGQLCHDFHSAYKKFGLQSIPETPSMIEGYIQGRIAVAALVKSGVNPTRKSVLSALNNLGHYDMGGFSVDFSPTQHNGSHYLDVGVLTKSGRMIY